ncbi:MAG: tail fiber domain-containing protein [Pseudomonadota bacterium]|nr:tail fiber domain-containing protein [Pseudomonadota bacterium]
MQPTYLTTNPTERRRMFDFGRRRRRGFTLIELAIVMAVAGLLFVGLWRLLASGNQQVRDQSAASQHQQLISAVKGFLVSQQGQTFMTAIAANGSNVLPLPATNTSNAACQADPTLTAAGVPLFCNFLPTGLSSATPNSYGQTYSIRVLKDSSPAGTPPNTYSFMVLSAGGDTIPDTSGGRISAFIGGDGGFVYTAAVCGAPAGQTACGSYGTWATNITAYGFPAANVPGHIASRTYVSPTSDSIFPWLARPSLPGDSLTSPIWNTMQTDLFLGNNIGTGAPNNFWLGSDSTAGVVTGGGQINAQGGSINMARTGTNAGGGTINLQGGIINDAPDNANTGRLIMTANGPLHSNAFVSLATNCTADTVSPNTGVFPAGTDPACAVGLQVTGDANVVGQMQAWDFYSQTFIYKGSDLRLKRDIHPLTDALSDIMKLKPVSYTLKSNGKPSLGVVAQDVEKVYPQLVSESNGMKAVEYEALIAPLIGAVQQLKHQNDELRQDLNAQKAEQRQLEEQLRRKQSP